MSGTGQKGSSAPTHLTPMAMDQPIGQTAKGETILATPYFGQMITRILAYLGQPVSSGGSGGGGGTNLTIGEQINNLQTAVELLAASGQSTADLSSRVAELESMISKLRTIVGPIIAEDPTAIAKTIATWGM